METNEAGLLEALRPFRCVRLRVEARASSRIQLPPYLGSTLRGAFGMALRRSTCVLRRQECATCLLRTRCVYSYAFETALSGSGEKERRYASAPHPFVLNLDTSPLGDREPGSQFAFGLSLIGRAADFLPYFVHAFERMGETGIGRGRGGFRVDAVRVLDGHEACVETIYEKGELRLPRTVLKLEDALSASRGIAPDGLTLRLVTPLRLLQGGALCREPHFPVLLTNLLRRLENLVCFHCEQDGEFPYGDLLERAEAIRLARNETRWYDWERYSNRQERRMKLGGLVGAVTYEGDLTPFLPLLALGEWVNVGKGTTFGLGRYRVEVHSPLESSAGRVWQHAP